MSEGENLQETKLNTTAKWYKNPMVIIGIIAGIVVPFILFFANKAVPQTPWLGNKNSGLRSGQVESPNLIPQSPSKIMSELEAYPPLQRKQAAQSYIGLKVDWLLTFNSADTNGGEAMVMLRERYVKGALLSLNFVVVSVPLSEYPRLKILRSGEMVRVQGLISSVENLWIRIAEPKLSFPSQEIGSGE